MEELHSSWLSGFKCFAGSFINSWSETLERRVDLIRKYSPVMQTMCHICKRYRKKYLSGTSSEAEEPTAEEKNNLLAVSEV